MVDDDLTPKDYDEAAKLLRQNSKKGVPDIVTENDMPALPPNAHPVPRPNNFGIGPEHPLYFKQ